MRFGIYHPCYFSSIFKNTLADARSDFKIDKKQVAWYISNHPHSHAITNTNSAQNIWRYLVKLGKAKLRLSNAIPIFSTVRDVQVQNLICSPTDLFHRLSPREVWPEKYKWKIHPYCFDPLKLESCKYDILVLLMSDCLWKMQNCS